MPLVWSTVHQTLPPLLILLMRFAQYATGFKLSYWEPSWDHAAHSGTELAMLEVDIETDDGT